MDVEVRQFCVTIDNSNGVLQGTMVLNASHRHLLEKNTERSGGKKNPPLNRCTSPRPPNTAFTLLRMPEDASNQYLIMLKPFNEQSMSLIDGVEWWEDGVVSELWTRRRSRRCTCYIT